MRQEITKERFKKGIIITFICIIVVLVIITVVDYKALNRNSDTDDTDVPDGTGWYRGWITEVFSTTERLYSENNQTVYDCNVIIQYDVAGQTYEKAIALTGASAPVLKGDMYYICCWEDNPENIHTISKDKKDKKDNSKNFLLLYDIIPIFIFLMFFVWFFKSGMYNRLEKEMVHDKDDYSGTSLRD